MQAPLDLRLVTTFVRAAQLGTLSATAVQVGRTQSAVTMQIQRLEEVLGHLPGVIGHGDLAVREHGEGGRLLPTAIFARWSNPR